MTSIHLFDMELDDETIEIDTPLLFEKIEPESKEYL